MQLISLQSNISSFKTVNFNPTGLSFIIAKQKNPGESERGKTYNGVGKSLLVALIHFCLGADKKDYKSFIENLSGWKFILKFQINEIIYISERAIDDIDKITLNNEPLPIKKFKEKIEPLCFDIPPGINFLSFRSLLPFFIRPKKVSYVNYDAPSKAGSDYQILINNSFLIGLDVFIAQEKYKLKKEQDRIKQLSDNIKKDNLLKEFFSGDKDVTLALSDLKEKIKHLENDLKKYEVAEDYYEIKSAADKIERSLAEIQNEIVLIQNQIDNIDESLKINPDLDRNNIENIYSEVNVHFPDKLTKSINDLDLFYKQLTENRIRRLSDHKRNLLKEIDYKNERFDKLKKELDEHLQYLGAHRALDIFININNQLANYRNEYDNLQKYNKLLDEYKDKILLKKEEMLKQSKDANEYLKKISKEIESIQNYFNSLAKRIYPHSRSGITIYNNTGENQIRYDIDAKIEADASDGINNVKIFCYDLSILFKGFGHSMKFLFHDSRLFDGIDERQKTDMFNILYDSFNNSDYQYIATVNQNQIEEIKQYLDKEQYDEIVTKNTVLTLTDDFDTGKLLGIQVDLNYE